jgi:TrmH family RNA methyltransferase
LREAERKFVIEGSRAVESALLSGVELEAIYYEPSANEMAARVLELASKIGYRTYEVASGTLERASDAVSPQTVAAIASFVDRDLGSIEPDSLMVVMAGVRDPGNAGTVMRTALAASASAVILCDQCVDIYNPKTVRSSAGAIFSVPISIASNFEEVSEYLKTIGYRIVGTSSHASTPYWEEELFGKVAIVLGNEGSGLDRSYAQLFDCVITIPMNPRAESLNVGVAGSILMFEGMRQRLTHLER